MSYLIYLTCPERKKSNWRFVLLGDIRYSLAVHLTFHLKGKPATLNLFQWNTIGQTGTD